MLLSAAQKEMIISGTADIHYMYCNPCLPDIVMYFITEQTKRFNTPKEFNGGETLWDDWIASTGMLHQISL